MGGAIKTFRKKNEKFEQSHSAEKRGKSHRVKKKRKGNPSALEWLFIACERFWMR